METLLNNPNQTRYLAKSRASEILGEVYYGEDESLYPTLDQLVFGLQFERIYELHGIQPAENRDQLYYRYKSSFAEVIAPTEVNLEERSWLIKRFNQLTALTKAMWGQEQFFRLLEDRSEGGFNNWIYNGQPDIISSPDDWELRKVGDFVFWHPSYQARPLKDENGMYVPYRPDKEAIVLLDPAQCSETEWPDLLAAHRKAVKKALPTETMSPESAHLAA